MQHDPWLSEWLPLIAERSGAAPVLEIGCGSGPDTETLVAAGLQVVAFDHSEDMVARARARTPTATITCQSISDRFPMEGRGIGAVIASLSLHYFPWIETQSLVARIRTSLRPAGVLVCRLNSTEDHHFGASGHAAIEPNFYLVDGKPKRFFDRKAVDALFAAGWRQMSVAHKYTSKYGKSKALWEVVAERHA